MSRGVNLGRVFGARLELGWSWLAVSPLLVAAIFGAIDPASGPAAVRALAALAGSVLLLVSVIGHEVGHVLAAGRHDIDVERVAVFLLGGFSEMDLDGATPREERAVALAGPTLSAGLGLVLWAASLASPAFGGADRVLLLLAAVNLGVAAFNLVPAYPLDGGRIARAALISWGVGHNEAERFTAGAGMAVGSAIVAFAAVASLLGRPISLLALPVGLMVATMAAAGRPTPDLKET